MTDQAMRAAVLGSPIAHSLSPALHRAAYELLGLDDWTYDAVECTEAELAAFVAGLGPDWAGLSLTMPLSRSVLRKRFFDPGFRPPEFARFPPHPG